MEFIEIDIALMIQVLLGMLLLAIIIVAFFVLRFFIKKSVQLKRAFELIVLEITLPKDVGGEKKTEETLQGIQEDIGVAETFFSSIGGMRAEKGFMAWFQGKKKIISFEIVAHEGLITFYVVTPKNLQSLIEQQIHAQYPYAHIEEIEDYNIFSPNGVIVGSKMKFMKKDMFPIKTYKNFESDPLNAVTNILSKLEKEDGVAIQIVSRSAHPQWHKASKSVASAVSKGKSVEEAMGGNKMHDFFFNSIFKVFDMITSIFTKTAETDMKKPDEVFKPSAMQEEMVKGLEEKSSKAGIEVNIRVVVSSTIKERAELILENINNIFSQYTIYQYGNGFKAITLKGRARKNLINDFIYRNFDNKDQMVLNTEEFTSIYHFPLPGIETPNIKWLEARKAPAPTNIPKEGLYLGDNFYRGVKTPIYIKDDDRRRHMYIIGKSGVGKSWLQANMARQDVKNGKGLCVIDPHGDLIDDILVSIPKERAEDVIIFNPSDFERPIGLNLLEYDPKYPEQKTFLINEMINIFDKLYDLKSTGGPIFEQYMRNSLLLIMDHPESGSTLMEVPKVLADENFRKYKLSKTPNDEVRHFWKNEAEKAGGEAALANVVPYITSKLTQFISNDTMRTIIGQQKSAFDFRKIMDEGKILLVKLSKGKIGDMNAYLLGMVLVGRILMSALSRTDIPQKDRKDFYLYIDEFQNFTTDSIAIILSEARKYGLNLIIAHQYIGQLVKNQDTSIKDAVFGNAGTFVSFKIGVEDAEVLAKEFAPVFSEYDVMNVPKANCYIKLLIDNTAARAFNLTTPWLEEGNPEIAKAITELSRLKHGRDRRIIEEEIKERTRKVERELEGDEEDEEDEDSI